MSVLEMSVSSGLLIIAIAVIRAIALNKLPKKMFLVLWSIALLRLLVPVSIPSRFSVYNMMNGMTKTIVTPALLPAIQNVMPIGNHSTTASTQLVQALPEAVTIITPLTLVWLAGMLVMLAFFTIAYIRNYRVLRSALPIHDASMDEWLTQNKLKRTLTIMQSDKVTSPIAVGVITPRIILPKAMDYGDNQLMPYILLHEYYHIRRFDMLWKLILVFALCIHWFNPLVWLMLILVNRDLEVTCDEMVISHFGSNTKTSYANSLISMAEQRSQFTPLYNGFSQNAAEERITAIMKYKKPTLASVVLAVLLTVAMATAFAASPANPAPQDITPPISNESLDDSAPSTYNWKPDPKYGSFDISYDKDGRLRLDGEPFYCIQSIRPNDTDTTNALVSISASEYDNSNWDTWNPNDTDSVESADSADSIEFFTDFAPYEEYGITVVETANSVLLNVYYQGEPVKIFFDGKNNGEYFMYQSWDVGDIFVETVYDTNGNLIGVEKK